MMRVKSTGGGTASDSDDEDGRGKRTVIAHAYADYRKLRREIKKYPERISSRFLSLVVEARGVKPGEQWRFRDIWSIASPR